MLSGARELTASQHQKADSPDSAKPVKHLLENSWIAWLIPFALLLLWQLSSSLGWLSARSVPTPASVIHAFLNLVSTGEIFQHLWASFVRALTGFLIGGAIGLFFGLLNGGFKVFDRLFDTTIQMIRNVPHLALIPLVILWFGIDEGGKLFLVALGTFFPIYLNTYHGIRSVDPELIELGKSYGLSHKQLFLQVIVPGALPSILVGVRYALGFMWLTLIVAETIAASSGIGYMAMTAREFMQTDIVVVAILLYAILGKLADIFSRLIEKRLLRWHSAYQ